ncbi:oligosaccharide flippase family protein [Proteus mirabilis]|uniref:oligosaccharide flippase family protein n=1 Tax=Proteus mirabilis TaxID=584 RepID=UPI002182538B|nr:oligosaccharide flippase family protein [Proteus mirabilis]MCT0099884.1 oligosaccharide flippase family protein [Proteus mirabilis]
MNFLIKTVNQNYIYIKNSAWIIVEKLLSIFGLIFVTSYVAKYIGPDNFGKLSYVISIFTIIQTISMLGMDTILFRRISKNRFSGINLMMSTIKLRIILYIIVSTLFSSYFIYNTEDYITIAFTISVAISYFFLAIDHYAIYFNAVLKSKINVYFNIIGLSLSLLLRYLIVYFKFEIIYLAIPIMLTSIIPFFLRFLYFHFIISPKKLEDKYRSKYIYHLIKTGIPISVSNVSIVIYSKISQILLATLISNYALGIFSVASTLAYAWLFVPQAIITSYFTKIYKMHNKNEIIISTSYLNIFISIIGLLYLLFIYLFGDFIIKILYGSEYTKASGILFFLAISSSISCLGTISYRYIIAFSGYSFLAKKMIFTSIISIIITYFLVKNYSINGAIIASISIEIISLTIFNYFFKEYLVLRMHIRTLLIPFITNK